MELMLFPGFDNREQVVDELARSIWYFEPIREQTKKIHLLYRGFDLTIEDLEGMLANFSDLLAPYFDPLIAEWAPRWSGMIELHLDHDQELEKNWSIRTTGIMVWGEWTDESDGRLRAIGDRLGLFYTHGSAEHQMNEAVNRNLFTRKLFSSERVAKIDERTQAGLQELRQSVNDKEIYVYGSAPSVSQLVEADYDFGNAEHIVCNSLVKNTELMDILKPRIVICGDPVFHGGPSRYAAEFRRTLNEFMGRYDSYLITFLDFVGNFEVALDEKFHDRIIGVRQSNTIDVNLDLITEPTVFATENILTLLLLPMAFTLSPNVSVLGCDGRSFVQDEYFWAHDKKSQFDDLMDETKLVHPAFFVRDFNGYYISHCETLEKVLSSAEARGMRPRTITPSYIPPLAKRYQAVI